LDHEETIRQLEQVLVNFPNNLNAATTLTLLLDSDMPGKKGLGAFSDCQLKIAEKYQKPGALSDLLEPSKAAQHYKEWQALLRAKNAQPRFPVPQLFMGVRPTIRNQELYCGQYMALFKQKEIFPQLCMDCFKVQIIAPDMAALMQVYFILRLLDLPKDNARKCMVEVRESIPNPYKGYIYCESEEEAKACADLFQQIQKEFGVTRVECRITHGCSEFGQKYPEYKYSDDGTHRSFKRPPSWDKPVSEFLASVELPKFGRSNFSKPFISIRDIVGIRTWIAYAQIIGDDSCKPFLSPPSVPTPEPFATRVRNQAQMRKAQLEELREMFASKADCATS
jgi:hypothetical protein